MITKFGLLFLRYILTDVSVNTSNDTIKPARSTQNNNKSNDWGNWNGRNINNKQGQ